MDWDKQRFIMRDGVAQPYSTTRPVRILKLKKQTMRAANSHPKISRATFLWLESYSTFYQLNSHLLHWISPACFWLAVVGVSLNWNCIHLQSMFFQCGRAVTFAFHHSLNSPECLSIYLRLLGLLRTWQFNFRCHRTLRLAENQRKSWPCFKWAWVRMIRSEDVKWTN